jgi:hypothetical protein
MQKIVKYYKKFERTIGGLKFAVIIISLFAIALTFGTFMESYHGTEFANRLVYKSWWFMVLQGCMFMSILMATLIRLPFKKPLYGFYVIHAGLIILFIGSFITYISGVDGSIQLLPNTPANKVMISEELLRIEYPKRNKVITFPLPFNAYPTEINSSYQDVTVKTFLPSAENTLIWNKSDQKVDHAGTYLIFNNERGISQEVTLALNPASDFKSTNKLGLLNIHYMPKTLSKCFGLNSKSGYIIWNTDINECYTPEQKNVKVGKTDQGNKFIAFEYKKTWLKFFPDFSPLPINDDLSRREDTPFRVFSRKIFEEKPHLFIFGESIAYYKKRKKKWLVKEFNDGVIKLPWMNFSLRLLEHRDGAYPVKVPSFIKPIQDSGKIIAGDMKAVKVSLFNKDYWVSSESPLMLDNGKEQIRFRITQKQLLLPYQINLDRFKMDQNPGTKDPASYESFVSLLDGRTNTGSESHHVYMNNPLKYDGFTFYQSSYFPIGPEEYGSVFSVNFDPGRPIKYLGSLLLVLGSIWHYIIRRKRKKHSNQAAQSVVLGEQNA